VVSAFEGLPDLRLVVVGGGPLYDRIAASAPGNVEVLGEVSDAGLRWLYANSEGLVAASYEDFGLTPLEAASFGKPTAALRWGGFLDTTVEGVTGVFFDEPEPAAIAAGIRRLTGSAGDPVALTDHAREFSSERFRQRVQAVVHEEAQLL
jgi:glycosyltransferase involved in cell wall biosynthesis